MRNDKDIEELLVVRRGVSYNRWLDRIFVWGFLNVKDVKRGDIIEVRTATCEFYFTAIDPIMPSVFIVSRQEKDFENGHLCNFIGSIWVGRGDDLLEIKWPDAEAKVESCLVKNFCPVVVFNGACRNLPPVLQVEIKGEKFFNEEIDEEEERFFSRGNGGK